jgi:hypothetical protein
MTVASTMVLLALSACSSSGTPKPGPSPSPSASADPLRGATLLLQLMHRQSSSMQLACNEYVAPDDPACGEAIEKVVSAAHDIRDYLTKIPSNAEVTKLDDAMARVEKSVDGLRQLTCYGLRTPPSPDIDQATKHQLCFAEYGIVLASVFTATDPMSYG